MEFQKPIPLKNQDNSPYWDAADRHQLKIQKCNDCQAYAHPPGPTCAKCGGGRLSWIDFGDHVKATIYSYIVSYRPFLPGFQDDLPLVIAQASLEDVPSVRIMCNVLDCKPDDMHIGMPVKMVWDDITEDRALPQWKPID
ncbi:MULTISPECIES: Zn-ribbon domain-containing OB-fold protein [Virgibacillus]|uniref:Zn-ribbon domain-containing OB-fold protein n=2 Tax=Virgibacillus TaxID=84406 RepID=A0ABQ2DUZ3_9BACI|nr:MULTISPECIES: OB-fold domain-containing protein [Virgibacillus]EQB36755.1 hypothetical protein M948_17120 [Virgibacillus sp. CM-4]MYL42583.1 hypothetical protein [Virgibacillus massiliensis]GGJ73926.1 hypothetical protein GCM10007111_39440 [Virgibacillus kapii]CDQ40464.1 putative nucleic-acid-binding protein containing a Zn-ribbon [Virgibacillus massiliensis]